MNMLLILNNNNKKIEKNFVEDRKFIRHIYVNKNWSCILK